MSTLIILIFALFGLFLFSWTLWRNLREDYPSEQIFSFTLTVLLGATLGFWVATSYNPALSFWLSFLGGIVAGIYSMRRFAFRFFEVIDAVAPSWFWLSLFILLGLSLTRQEARLFLLLEAAASFLSLVSYWFLIKRYRRFSWYPSGKIGFAGMTSLAIYFVLRAIVEIVPTDMLSFFQSLSGAIASLTSALLLLVVVYLRSGRERAERIAEKFRA